VIDPRRSVDVVGVAAAGMSGVRRSLVCAWAGLEAALKRSADAERSGANARETGVGAVLAGI